MCLEKKIHIEIIIRMKLFSVKIVIYWSYQIIFYYDICFQHLFKKSNRSYISIVIPQKKL